MKYDHGHWEGGGRQGGKVGPLHDDPFENHQEHIDGYTHIGGIHGKAVGCYHPGEHNADDMSAAADAYLKLLK